MLSGVELVSWDVDGTLYSLPAARRVLMRAARRDLFSLRVVRSARELALLGRFSKAMARVRDAGGVLPAGALDERARVMAAELRWYGPALARVGAAPGVLDAVDAVARAGLRQVVVSDYVSDYKLEALGLAGRFERVFAGESVGYLKPSPELFRHVVADMGVDAGAVLHIGDCVDTDGAAAGAAGCRVLILGEDVADPRQLAESLARRRLGE